jgi:UDP-glucose 4-epimerase
LRILITGSRGFVGGTIGRLAAQAGHKVLGIGRSSQPEVYWPGSHAQADVSQADLCSLVHEFMPDVVLHAAGSASVGSSFADPAGDFRAALGTWSNVLDAVRRSGRRPLLVFPSSAAVYGNPSQVPVREDARLEPISPYGFHKAACEWIGREYATCFGLRILVCRLFSVFGARQRRLLAWELYSQIAGPAREVWLDGTGEETRDYLAIEDVASAMLKLTEVFTDETDAEVFRIINIGRGEEINVLQLARLVCELTGEDKKVRCRGQARAGDPSRWCADTSLLAQFLPSWQPVPLRESLAGCISAWKQGGIMDGR